MKRRLSLTSRLTVFFAITSGIVLLGLVWVITLSIEKHFLAQDKESLIGKLQLVRNVISQVDNDITLNGLPQKLKTSLVGHKDLIVLIMSAEGRVLYQSSDIYLPVDEVIRNLKTNSEEIIEWRHNVTTYRGITASIDTNTQPKLPILVLVALNINHHDIFISRFQGTLLFYTIVAALISGLLGWIAARRGLLPLYIMKDQALSVTANQLTKRMPVESVPIEISGLANALNQMLEHLEDAFKRLSGFSSDIAHELRTPVSNLLTQTQVALSRPRDAETYKSILASNAEEYEHLSRMISDMLFLAKADNGLIPPSSITISLDEQVNDLFEFYDALAEDRQVSLTLTGKGNITGDQLMIRLAINNLLSNAIRHTPDAGAIEVTIVEVEDSISLSVCNPGAAIPQSDIPHLFERFYRADQNRTKEDSNGCGLGLAITDAILKAHGSTITVTSDHQQTCFTMLFPYPN